MSRALSKKQLFDLARQQAALIDELSQMTLKLHLAIDVMRLPADISKAVVEHITSFNFALSASDAAQDFIRSRPTRPAGETLQ